MIWPFNKQERSMELSVSDAGLVSFLNPGAGNYSGVTVTESTALTLSPVWRAVSLIAQTLASCEVNSVQKFNDGTFEKVDSWVDDPAGGSGATRFEFWETVTVHLLLHGNAYLMHVYSENGTFMGLYPVHPLGVTVDVEDNQKRYKITLSDGSFKYYNDATMTHIPALSLDGIMGVSPIQTARNSLGVAVAGERAAAKMFSNGSMIQGMVTPEEDVTPEEAQQIKESIDLKMQGWDNAGDIPVINRKLKFTPWSMSNADAEFLSSRMFQVEEIARWFGVPPHLLMQTEKQTSWGSGVAEQNRGLSRTVLGPWARRIEDRVTKLLPAGQTLVFDFAPLERPNPEQETELILRQIQGGLLTPNEGRAMLNRPSAPNGDQLFMPAGSGGATTQGELDDGTSPS